MELTKEEIEIVINWAKDVDFERPMSEEEKELFKKLTA